MIPAFSPAIFSSVSPKIPTWSKEMLDLLLDWIEKDDRAAAYRGMDWSHEYDLAINGDPNDTQSAL